MPEGGECLCCSGVPLHCGLQIGIRDSLNSNDQFGNSVWFEKGNPRENESQIFGLVGAC